MLWSIIICTYNRATDLKFTIEKLHDINYNRDEYEVIVVDNGSTDNTEKIVNELSLRLSKIIYLREEKQGLAHARNAGLSIASGKFVAFLDDDAYPDKEWIKEFDQAFNQLSVMCVGGAVVPSFQRSKEWPKWIHKRLRGLFSVVDYGKKRDLHYPDYPIGTNIGFRRAIFAEVGFFDSSFGRSRDCLLSMEETDICLRIEEAGYRIVYNPSAVVHHRIHEYRLTKDWIKQRALFQGVSAARLETTHFSKVDIYLKTIKYIFFIFCLKFADLIFSLGRNEKFRFFCICQAALCRGYIKSALKFSTSKRA
jgi:glucosyl-dolichyl phosphate glucuronosyltransferase